MPRMLGMFHLWFTPFTVHSLCHITPGRLCWNLGIPLCTDCSRRTWKSENRQMLSTSHLQLLIKSVLNWIQVTSELPVLILNKFRDVINPPYCLDMLWHISVIPAASVSLHRLHISPFFLINGKQKKRTYRKGIVLFCFVLLCFFSHFISLI